MDMKVLGNLSLGIFMGCFKGVLFLDRRRKGCSKYREYSEPVVVKASHKFGIRIQRSGFCMKDIHREFHLLREGDYHLD